jgi:hypothetical protein
VKTILKGYSGMERTRVVLPEAHAGSTERSVPRKTKSATVKRRIHCCMTYPLKDRRLLSPSEKRDENGIFRFEAIPGTLLRNVRCLNPFREDLKEESSRKRPLCKS